MSRSASLAVPVSAGIDVSQGLHSGKPGNMSGMRRRDETAHRQTPLFAQHELERVQEEIRLHNEDASFRQISHQGPEQSGKKEGLA